MSKRRSKGKSKRRLNTIETWTLFFVCLSVIITIFSTISNYRFQKWFINTQKKSPLLFLKVWGYSITKKKVTLVLELVNTGNAPAKNVKIGFPPNKFVTFNINRKYGEYIKNDTLYLDLKNKIIYPMEEGFETVKFPLQLFIKDTVCIKNVILAYFIKYHEGLFYNNIFLKNAVTPSEQILF